MQIDPLDNLLNAMDVAENFEAPDNFQNNDASSITLTDPISAGDLSSNVPIQQNAFNMDVNQVPQNPAQMENANMAIDLDNIFDQQAIAPVIVNGNLPALNFDNFPILGVGVQNLMLAYHEAKLSSEDENMAVENSGGSNANQQEADSEGFHHFNEVEPELAHIHLGRVQTFFHPMKMSESSQDMNFSEEGMQLWDKYFAPHIDKKAKVIHIPANWFNFITLMLVTPEKFDWAKQFLSSSLWKIMIENDSRENCIPFVVPDSCYVQQAPVC
jgi:hypothetical protein